MNNEDLVNIDQLIQRAQRAKGPTLVITKAEALSVQVLQEELREERTLALSFRETLLSMSMS